MKQEEQRKVGSLEFRRALGRFASGIAVITTVDEGQVHGMTANAFVSVSLEPPLVLVSLDNRAKLRRLLARSGRYGVSILNDRQENLSRHFAGRSRKVAGENVRLVWRHDMPLLDAALAHLVCRVVDIHPAGDHTLYIAHVDYLDYSSGSPLLFYTGEYGSLEVKLWDHSYIWKAEPWT